MNIGHVYLLQNNKIQAIEWYQKSIVLFKDMESDYLDLKMEERGISKADYQSILKILKEN